MTRDLLKEWHSQICLPTRCGGWARVRTILGPSCLLAETTAIGPRKTLTEVTNVADEGTFADFRLNEFSIFVSEHAPYEDNNADRPWRGRRIMIRLPVI